MKIYFRTVKQNNTYLDTVFNALIELEIISIIDYLDRIRKENHINFQNINIYFKDLVLIAERYCLVCMLCA